MAWNSAISYLSAGESATVTNMRRPVEQIYVNTDHLKSMFSVSHDWSTGDHNQLNVVGAPVVVDDLTAIHDAALVGIGDDARVSLSPYTAFAAGQATIHLVGNTSAWAGHEGSVVIRAGNFAGPITNGENSIVFQTGPSSDEKMRITNNNRTLFWTNVGIGATYPVERLDIVDGSNQGALRIGDTDDSEDYAGTIKWDGANFLGCIADGIPGTWVNLDMTAATGPQYAVQYNDGVGGFIGSPGLLYNDNTSPAFPLMGAESLRVQGILVLGNMPPLTPVPDPATGHLWVEGDHLFFQSATVPKTMII